MAAFFGTLQAGFTDFHYLRNIWQKNTEKDALIGVGITGIANGNILDLNLREAAQVAKDENERIAAVIGINKAARVTTIKPSGTTSCVVGTSSGIHAWHSKFYIRNMQCKVGDDLYTFFSTYYPELIKVMEYDPNSAVIGIPQEAPDEAILRENENALEMLERVNKFNIEWVQEGHRKGPNTNNVSATVSVNNKSAAEIGYHPELTEVTEWDLVGQWMWENRTSYNGLSVLPYDGGSYKDAPFMSVDREEFDRKVNYITENNIDLTLIKEEEDNTVQKDEVACGGGSCDIV